MVRITYDFAGEHQVEENTEPNFLLTNKKGGYFLNFNSTKYRGLFLAEPQKKAWDLVKSVDTISITKIPSEIVYNIWGVEKKYGKASEKFFFYNNTLFYEVDNYSGTSLLTLDVRPIHDFDANNRKYNISEENNFIIIRFKKDDFTRFLAIKTDAKHKVINQWKERKFDFDKNRKSMPDTMDVFEALHLKIDGNARLAISCSKTKEKAMNEANYIYYSHYHLKSQIEKNTSILFRQKKISKRLLTAYKCSIKSLEELYVEIGDIKGFYAGLPWYYQIWTRDEAISLGALISEGRYELVRDIILRQTSKILTDGRTPNRIPNSTLGTADGVGWVFKRFGDLFNILQRRKKISSIFTEAEISAVFSALKDSLKKIKRYYVRNGLTINRKKETWMDTDLGNDPRDGARIEIQALTLNMVCLAKDLSLYLDDPDFKKFENLEKEMKKKVKSLFFNNGILSDGYNDPTIRPNIFLAYFVYPKLLRKKEWSTVFRNSLEALWLDWGGLTTIDKKNPLYQEEYTGMEDKSYHRGDSWYWINNLAAICLYRVDRKLFSKYIKDIINASTKEILEMGTVACHCEISSAKKQRSEGSPSQTWSSAMYIEMINELFR